MLDADLARVRTRSFATLAAAIALATIFFATGCSPGANEDELISAVCAASVTRNRDSERVDFGLLSFELPSGYRVLRVESQSIHGGVAIGNASGQEFGITNGYWEDSSFMRDDGSIPPPDCQFEVDGIPVHIYSPHGEDWGYEDGMVPFMAVIDFPGPSDPARSMNVQAGALIRRGDMAHAIAYGELIRSMRKGDPEQYIHAPGTTFRKRPQD
jgi:hypothetical protein